MIISLLSIVIGLVILIFGAEWLVRGASSLAAKLRVSSLVIGLTVVSFGTSAPELTINIFSALNGSTDLAVANVIGSNIANIWLILGISAIIIPLTVKSSTVWKEIPLAFLGVVLIFIMANDSLFDGFGYNALTRTDGFALIALMIIFMYYIFSLAKHDRKKAKKAMSEAAEEIKTYGGFASAGLTFGGLAALVIGGRLLVDGAIDIAAAAGLSEALIGLTIVAVGTSLPELATSAVAALKGKADIAIGNVVGSNIFNVFFVLGTTSVIAPLQISSMLSIDILVAVFATTLLFIYMFSNGKHRLTRAEGISFVILYVLYTIYLIYRG